MLCFACSFALSQEKELKTKTVTSEAEVDFPDYKSLELVKREAFDNAKNNALNKAFGTSDIVGNSAIIQDKSDGKVTKTSYVFSTISNSFVRGEIIEILDENYKEIQGIQTIDGKTRAVKVMKCTIRVKVREIPDAAANFTTYALKCPDTLCITAKFKNKESFYLYFKGYSNGYLIVFLQDIHEAQCIFPYSKHSEKYKQGVPVIAGKDYIFFSNKNEFNYFDDIRIVDQLEMQADVTMDHNRLFILFSRNPISVPELSSGNVNETLSPSEISQKYTLPKSMDAEKFNRWLTKARNHDTELRLATIDITIEQ